MKMGMWKHVYIGLMSMTDSEFYRYTGSCHCQSITFEFNAPLIHSGMHCNCSICKRKGALLTSFTVPSERVKVNDKNLSHTCYQFGSKVAKHYFCDNCGIFTSVSTRLNPGERRFNLGCIDGLDIQSLQIEYYNGMEL